MKIWLDDVRQAPRGWMWCRTPEEVIELLKTGDVDEISLDHDLNLLDRTREATGMDVLLWIEQQVALEGFKPPRMLVHSANPPAHQRMLAAITAIERLSRREQR